MRLDQLAHDREPHAETAVASIEPALALDEQIENARQELGRDADAAVLHAQHRLIAFGLDLHDDGAARRRVLQRIRQEVREHLLQPRAVTMNRRTAETQRELMSI